MNWDAIAAIGELLAAVAVIFSLLYVGKQLAQNNRNQRLVAIQANNEAFRENIAMLLEHADVWIAGLYDDTPLSPGQYAQFALMVHASFRHVEQTYMLNTENVLSDEVLDNLMQVICSLYAYPGCKKWWETRKDVFTRDFQQRVETFVHNEELKPLPYRVTP